MRTSGGGELPGILWLLIQFDYQVLLPTYLNRVFMNPFRDPETGGLDHVVKPKQEDQCL